MKFKRFMALAMAGVMTLGMAMTAFAEPEETQAETQQPYGSVKISKSVVNNTGADTTVNENKTFTFTFTAKNNEPTLDPVTVTFEKDKSFADAVEAAIDVESKISALGEYHYTIKETPEGVDVPNALWTTDSTEQELVVYVTNTGKTGDSGIEKKYEYAIYGPDEESGKVVKKDTAAFKNIYRPISGGENGSLTLKKEVEGQQWSDTNTYKFNVTFTDGDYTKIKDFTIKGGTDKKSLETIEVTGGTAFVVSLGKDETYYFEGIPQGTKFEIVEDTTGYGQYFKEDKTEISGDATKDEQNKLKCTGTLGKDTSEVQYKNFFESGITPTGLALNVAPFIAMFAAVGAAIALYVAAKRRVR